MTANELIRFIELIDNIRPTWMTFNEALIDIGYTEDIKANKAGLRKLETHWKIVLADRIAQSGTLQLHRITD